MPTIALILVYDSVPRGPGSLRASSGGHADFINGWDEDVLAKLVAAST